ncbi:MAG: ATP-binding protein [Gemmatimonadaceae bacterium]
MPSANALAAGAPLLQALLTLGLALLLWHLYRRQDKAHFLWWAIALGLRVLSVGAIAAFMFTRLQWLLYAHQVLLAWTALGLLYAAEVFSQQLAWDRRYLWWLALPVAWSYVAIFLLDNFALAAGPAVLFLSLATLRAGIVFSRYRNRTDSSAAGFLAWVMFLWAAHHLDYPLLRARGAWDPWGYYLDIALTLAMGAGVLLLVIEEQREGLRTLAALSGDLRADLGARGATTARGARASDAAADPHTVLLARPLELRGVRGAMLLRLGLGHGATERSTSLHILRGVGDCAQWTAATIPERVAHLAREAAAQSRPRLQGRSAPVGDTPPFVAALPLGAHDDAALVLVIVGDVAAPFAALDDRILTVIGEQVGAALEREQLSRGLAQRSDELERLSVRMLTEHEAQRRRLGRELHDETAQVFSALKLQLGLVREETPAALQERFDRLIAWVDRGSDSIRNATEGLRPAVLDDLGLLPALRALVADVREWSGLAVTFETTAWTTTARGVLTQDAEVALFRGLQEALSNVVRHAQATSLSIVLELRDGRTRLTVRDDGVGLSADRREHLATGPGRSGLIGMRERVAAAGGVLTLTAAPERGLIVHIELPVRP